MEADEVVAAILGLGSPAYRYVFDLPYKTWSYLLKRNVDHRACIAYDRPEGHGRAVHLLLAAAWRVQDSHLGQESLCLKNLPKGKDASRWPRPERAPTAPRPASEDG